MMSEQEVERNIPAFRRMVKAHVGVLDDPCAYTIFGFHADEIPDDVLREALTVAMHAASLYKDSAREGIIRRA